MHSKSTVILFAALLGGLAVLNLLTPSRVFSEQENRYLKQMPSPALNTVTSGKFMSDFDEYIIDQFAFRDGWVGVKTQAERTLGKRSSSGVYFAEDGYLIEMFDSVNQSQWQKNLDYVAEFSQRTGEELEVPVSVLLVPTASYILGEKLPAFSPEINQRELLEQAAEAIPGAVDVSGALLAHNGEDIYYRTDHHWTSLGACYAYGSWREQTGRQARLPEQFRQELLTEDFYGTTYSKASLYSAAPDTITGFLPEDLGEVRVEYNLGESVADSIYERSYLEVKDKYSVFLNANQPVTQIRTDVENGERLLIIKDSYANTFAQMLLGDYEEITLIDLRYYKTSVAQLIVDENITEVLVLYNVKGFSIDNNLYYLAV